MEIEDYKLGKRELGNGRWDKLLKRNMTELSLSDNYDDAKHEWRATGEVWWQGIGTPRPNWAAKHPRTCLCGHRIVYHFEIENTETGVRECVGSDHINSYLILRAIREETGLSDENITDEMIEEWITVRVEALKKTAWWNVHGEAFVHMFDAVKDIDLRVNVREGKKRYYDSEIRRYKNETYIRKRSTGEVGDDHYEMASIVWRWNHPDNPKAQANKRGYPNDKLWMDLIRFFADLENVNLLLKKEDDLRAKQIETVKKHDDLQKKIREEQRKRRDKVVENMNEIKISPAFTAACEYYGVPVFVAEQGKDSWEERFLGDIKGKMVKGTILSENQISKLNEILLGKKKDVPATDKQKNYLLRLGYEGDVDDITKSQASDEIGKLKNSRWS